MPVKRILRSAAVGRRAEARIAPGAGPDVGQRIDLGVGVRFLVADQRGVRRVRCVDAVFPTGLPEHFVAAEERQIDAGVAGRLDVGPLLARPVFVVTNGDEHLVLEQLGAAAVGVDAGGIADVVAVSLQEADHRILGAEEVGERGVVARGQRPVVAHLVRAAHRQIAAVVQAAAAVVVVGLPGRVGGLEQQIGMSVVVADHEDDVAFAEDAVFARQLGDVNARHGRRRNVPRGRDSPVAGVDEACLEVLRADRADCWPATHWD